MQFLNPLFERSDRMKFSEALIECVENGKRITRKDWNGKDMYVYYTCGRKIPATSWDDRGNIKLTDHERMVGYVEVLGHLDMYNAQGKRIIGWMASQTDMTSDQWEIYPDEKQ